MNHTQSPDQPYSAEEVRARQARNKSHRERTARGLELVSACLLTLGLLSALLFPYARERIAGNIPLLLWYSAFVVIGVVTVVYYFRRARRPLE